MRSRRRGLPEALEERELDAVLAVQDVAVSHCNRRRANAFSSSRT